MIASPGTSRVYVGPRLETLSASLHRPILHYIYIHTARYRLGQAPSRPQLAAMEKRVLTLRLSFEWLCGKLVHTVKESKSFSRNSGRAGRRPYGSTTICGRGLSFRGQENKPIQSAEDDLCSLPVAHVTSSRLRGVRNPAHCFLWQPTKIKVYRDKCV